MSELPRSSKYRSTPQASVSDAEREDLASRLNDEYSRGHLDHLEYNALLDTVYDANTLGELVPVVEKLPTKQTYEEPAIVTQQSAAEPGELLPAGRDGRQLAPLAYGLAGLATIAAIIIVLIVLL